MFESHHLPLYWSSASVENIYVSVNATKLHLLRLGVSASVKMKECKWLRMV